MREGEAVPEPGPGLTVRGRRLVCGAASRARVARLLGLERHPQLYSVEKVEWAADHVEVTLAGTAGQSSLTLVLAATRPGRPAFLVGPEVSLWVQGAEVPEPLAVRLR